MKVKLIYAPISANYGKNLLAARGVKNIDEFLSPSAECIQDYKDLDNIEKGLNLIANLSPSAKVGMIVD